MVPCEGRLIQLWLYYRNGSPDDNHYAHPLDFILVVDLNLKKVWPYISTAAIHSFPLCSQHVRCHALNMSATQCMHEQDSFTCAPADSHPAVDTNADEAELPLEVSSSIGIKRSRASLAVL